MARFCIVFISAAACLLHRADHCFNDSTSFLANLFRVIGALLRVDHRSVYLAAHRASVPHVLSLPTWIPIVVRHILSYLRSQNPAFVARQLQAQR
jgi:hypothetical protein